MNLSRIAADKPLPAQIWQSGWIDEPQKLLNTIPKPFGIASLAIDPNYSNSWASDLMVESTFLWRHIIEDDERGLFSDAELLSIASHLTAYLRAGINLHVHCIAGRSRSSYIIGAVLCVCLGISGEEAIALISRDRPESIGIFQPSFQDQLKRLFPG